MDGGTYSVPVPPKNLLAVSKFQFRVERNTNMRPYHCMHHVIVPNFELTISKLPFAGTLSTYFYFVINHAFDHRCDPSPRLLG